MLWKLYIGHVDTPLVLACFSTGVGAEALASIAALDQQPLSLTPPPLPNPRSYIDPRLGLMIHKITVLYAHNPLDYTEVQRVGGFENAREIVEHDVALRKLIRENEHAISRFVRFLQKYGVPVAYDQLLWDTSADNALKWLNQQIEQSRYIILIITPSLIRFLSADELPPTEREMIFTGRILFNLLHSSEYENKLLPVFLNQPKDTRLLPLPLKNAVHMYEVHERFFEQDLRAIDSDLQRLYRLLTSQKSNEMEFLGVYHLDQQMGKYCIVNLKW